ncbi:MAG: zinc ribbon domain-containing protein [candidate division NC10 bacterium]
MPTYEYQCRSCAHRLEAFQSITASPLTRCPHCGKKVDWRRRRKTKRVAAGHPLRGVPPREMEQARSWRHEWRGYVRPNAAADSAPPVFRGKCPPSKV